MGDSNGSEERMSRMMAMLDGHSEAYREKKKWEKS